MKVLFATHRTHPPDRGGGAQRSMHELLDRLLRRGHHCEAIATLPAGPGLTAFRAARRLSGRTLSAWRDGRLSYPVWRTWEPLVPRVLERRILAHAPDIVVIDYGSTLESLSVATAHQVPVLLRIVDAEFAGTSSRPPVTGLVRPYANSRFTAERFAAWANTHVPTVIYPIVNAREYVVDRCEPSHVTLINPRPVKGLALTLEVAARLPDRQFALVESWPLPRPQRLALERELAQRPNVTLQRWNRDPRTVYARTAVLLVPSQCEEAFGRVVIEAQANGIPVIARNIGGLPESVGRGGLLLPCEAGAGEWADALQRLLSDRALSDVLRREALANVCRSDLQPETIADQFERLLFDHASVAGTRARHTA